MYNRSLKPSKSKDHLPARASKNTSHLSSSKSRNLTLFNTSTPRPSSQTKGSKANLRTAKTPQTGGKTFNYIRKKEYNQVNNVLQSVQHSLKQLRDVSQNLTDSSDKLLKAEVSDNEAGTTNEGSSAHGYKKAGERTQNKKPSIIEILTTERTSIQEQQSKLQTNYDKLNEMFEQQKNQINLLPVITPIEGEFKSRRPNNEMNIKDETAGVPEGKNLILFSGKEESGIETHRVRMSVSPTKQLVYRSNS